MRRPLTLRQYVRRRNGVPLGHSQSLANMLRRSFGAQSIAGFWRHWNPIWSYGLGRYVFAPLRRALPVPVALVATFVVSGLLHDAVIMLIRREPALLFTPWFLVLGIGVVVSDALRWRFSTRPFTARAAIITGYGALSLALSLPLTAAFDAAMAR